MFFLTSYWLPSLRLYSDSVFGWQLGSCRAAGKLQGSWEAAELGSCTASGWEAASQLGSCGWEACRLKKQITIKCQVDYKHHSS